jgi:large subunit ribosomal protein L22
MQSSARLRNNPKTNNNAGSSRKARLVADQIRGLSIDKALGILKFSTKDVSRRMEQVLLCAVNNWKQENKLDPADQNLFVKEVRIDAGKTMKRFQAAPHGRAHRIRKRTHHIYLTVASKAAESIAPVADAAKSTESKPKRKPAAKS